MLTVSKADTFGGTSALESPTSQQNLQSLQDQLGNMKKMDFNSLLKTNPFNG